MIKTSHCDVDFGAPGQKLVLVEWEDSTQPVPNWTWLSEKSPAREGIVRCQSVGWLIHDGDDVKVLAPNRGALGEHVQVCGVIRIPARAVVKVRTLRTLR